ncbi:MAG: hypothetical protein JWO94_3832 [Verrucomicrobiaceae bacterium]|nr:hypothetical protein [Verrucomicrobiaceae bacterium]
MDTTCLPASLSRNDKDVLFFPVSTTKLIVMSLVTFGLYRYYWLYQNWKLVARHTCRDLSPFGRTYFWPFYCNSLFNLVKTTAQSNSVEAFFSPVLITCLWIGLALCLRLPDPYRLIELLAFTLLIPVQQAVNALNDQVAPDHDRNTRFTRLNVVGIVVGGLGTLLIIYATFIPD